MFSLNPGPQIFTNPYCNVRGLKANLNNVAVASLKCDLILYSETLVSIYRHMSRNFVSLIWINIFCWGGILFPVSKECMSVCIISSFYASHVSKHECGCHEVVVVKAVGCYNNHYIYPLYGNPNLDDSIYDCLLSAMTGIQNGDLKASYMSSLVASTPTTENGWVQCHQLIIMVWLPWTLLTFVDVNWREKWMNLYNINFRLIVGRK